MNESSGKASGQANRLFFVCKHNALFGSSKSVKADK